MTPLTPIDGWAVLASTLKKEMLWDMLGPQPLAATPEKFGVQPASPDVFNMENQSMLRRKYSLVPIRNELSMLSFVAGQVAAEAMLAMDDRYENLPEEERLSFKANAINMGSAMTDAVIGHLFQQGLIHLGGHP